MNLETNETLVLTEALMKLSDLIQNELETLLVNLSGNLTDIECGTHIKIPTRAGYVNFYKSVESYKLSCWMTQEMREQMPMDT